MSDVDPERGLIQSGLSAQLMVDFMVDKSKGT